MTPRRAVTAHAFGGKPARPAMRVAFKAWQNAAGSVAGFLKIETASGLVIDGAKLMIGAAGKLWIAMPAIKQTDADGRPRLVEGKAQWTQVVSFPDRNTSDRFQEQVIAALRQQHPEIFDGGIPDDRSRARAALGRRQAGRKGMVMSLPRP